MYQKVTQVILKHALSIIFKMTGLHKTLLTQKQKWVLGTICTHYLTV